MLYVRRFYVIHISKNEEQISDHFRKQKHNNSALLLMKLEIILSVKQM